MRQDIESIKKETGIMVDIIHEVHQLDETEFESYSHGLTTHT